MGKTTGAYEKLAHRLAETIILFHQQEQVTRQQLAETFNVSGRTIFRDLRRLSAIIEHISGDSYCLAPQYYQALRTRDIRQLLDMAGVSPLFAGQKPAFWSTLLQTEGIPQFSIKYPAAEHESENALSRHFSQLRKAIAEHRKCNFFYKGKLRVVEPYRLVNVKNVWYLAAMEQENLKGFLLSGMKWLELCEETFVREGRIEQCIDEEDDVWFSLNKFPVRLHVNASVAGYFLRRGVLPSQVINTQNSDGSLEITCKIADERQLLPWVRYWLPNLTILSPESLHATLLTQLADALTVFSSPDKN
ncbi:transcriptional regulator [Pseudescherichia sp.]|uniref:helix-turn-helix transcriptional regulator n=1 Tax=Pseudescherichia sp. TaxID=2055881 RepID=UPI0028993F49|nr:transcriptional regulator [Pseudescherichia sp.]